MGISEIDPIAHRLPFERFLETNPARTIQFRIVAYFQIDRMGDVLKPIQDISCSDAISIQQANSVDFMPFLVVENICRNKSDFNLTSIPRNDAETFETLRSGNVDEISQFDGIDARRLLSVIKPKNLTDIAVITAILIGQDNGLRMLDTINQKGVEPNRKMTDQWLVREALEETRGFLLFQEQIMLVLNRVADIPLADAYSFIKTVCKRQWEQVAITREWFVVEATGNGMNETDALTLFDGIRDAAARTVCKAHHLSEAMTIYQMTFLKTHFPEEFAQTLQVIHH
jgi:DNA polymerase-3 subunit alpha